MPKVTCPECRAAAEVDEEDLGQDVYCPSCGEIFRARESFPEPPRRPRDEPPVARSPRRRREDDDDYDDDDYDEERERRRRDRRKRRSGSEHREEVVEDARRSTFLPALFSIIACVIGVLYHIADGLIVWMDPQILNQNPFGGGAGMPLEAYLAFRAFSILWELVILIGSVMMMKLRSRQFAMITMIMHIIPCAGVCCLIGLPVGIWGLVTVLRPDVADGFAYVEQCG